MKLFVIALAWLLQTDAVQQKASAPKLTMVDGEDSEDGEMVWLDTEDYSPAIQKFLKKNPNGMSDSLQRVNMSSINEFWEQIEKSGHHGDDARKILLKKFDNMPVIIPNTTEELKWPARELWEAKKLRARLGKLELADYSFGFRTEGSTSKDSDYRIIPPTMETLGQYMDQNVNGGNHLLFINEARDSYVHPSELKILNLLKNDWHPRPVFAYQHEDQHSLMFPEHIAAGHGWHYHDQVWHAQVVGRKLWHLYPPTSQKVPDRGLILKDGTHHYVPNTCAYLSGKLKAPKGTIEVFTHPGDTLLLPGNWWHATCALDTWTMGAGTFLKFQDVAKSEKDRRIERGW